MKRNATNAELLVRLVTWAVFTLFLFACDYLLDPLLSPWLPLYPLGKLALAAWMVHPKTLGAYLIFVHKLGPWVSSLELHS